MNETQEIVSLYESKYKILINSLKDLDTKVSRFFPPKSSAYYSLFLQITKFSETVGFSTDKEKELKFIQFIKKYINFFTESFSNFEKGQN